MLWFSWVDEAPSRERPRLPRPFVSMELDPAGNAYAPAVRNQLYPLGHVADASLAEIWAGPRAQALRAALAAGDLSLGCSSCRWADEHGNDQTIARLYDASSRSRGRPRRAPAA